RAVVAAGIEMSGDTEGRRLLCNSRDRRLKPRILNVFHQAEAVRGRGYAEDGVVGSDRGRKVRLRQGATSRVRASGDGKQIMDAAIRRSIGVLDETHLADRTVCRDE